VEPIQLSKLDPGLHPTLSFLLGPQSPLTPEELDVLDSYVSSGIPVVAALNRRVVFPKIFAPWPNPRTGTVPGPLRGPGGTRFCNGRPVQQHRYAIQRKRFLVKYLPFVLSNDLNKDPPRSPRVGRPGISFRQSAHPNAWVAFHIDLHLARAVLPQQLDLARAFTTRIRPAFKVNGNRTPPPIRPLGTAERCGPVHPGGPGGRVHRHLSGTPPPSAPYQTGGMGTSFFANPQVPNPEGNALFILALAQWLTQEGNDLSDPSKKFAVPPAETGSPMGPPVDQSARVFPHSLAVVLAGVLHWRTRPAPTSKSMPRSRVGRMPMPKWLRSFAIVLSVMGGHPGEPSPPALHKTQSPPGAQRHQRFLSRLRPSLSPGKRRGVLARSNPPSMSPPTRERAGISRVAPVPRTRRSAQPSAGKFWALSTGRRVGVRIKVWGAGAHDPLEWWIGKDSPSGGHVYVRIGKSHEAYLAKGLSRSLAKAD
jgi:hypothetical protein